MTRRDKLLQEYAIHYKKIAEDVDQGHAPPIYFNSGFLGDGYDSRLHSKHSNLYTHLIDNYNIDTNNKTLIELGCGFGNGCYFLKNKYNLREVVGCDINPVVINVAQQLYTKTKFIIEDIVSLQSLKRQFDIALTIETGTYWINNPNTNDSFSSVVKPDGYLLVATDIRHGVNIESQLKDFVLVNQKDITDNILLSLNENTLFQKAYIKRIERLNTTYKYVSQVYKKREQ